MIARDSDINLWRYDIFNNSMFKFAQIGRKYKYLWYLSCGRKLIKMI